MSAGRYAFVIGLGIATYFAANEAPTPEEAPAPVASLRAPAASPSPAPAAPPSPSAPVVRHAPPVVPPPPRTGPSETELALIAQLQAMNARLEALTLQVAELNRRKSPEQQTAAVRRPRPARPGAPEDGRLDPVVGAPPVAAPRRAEVDQRAVLELAKVTEHLMQRIEKLEKE